MFLLLCALSSNPLTVSVATSQTIVLSYDMKEGNKARQLSLLIISSFTSLKFLTINSYLCCQFFLQMMNGKNTQLSQHFGISKATYFGFSNLKTTEIYCSLFWIRGNPSSKGQQTPSLVKTNSNLRMTLLSLCSLMVRVKKTLFDMFYKGTNPPSLFLQT